MVRAFIAVEISPEARDALAGVMARLREGGVSGVRWARPESIHLTLKFLGDIDPALVDRTLAGIESASHGQGPFNLGLSELGAFPSLNSPRVIWVGLKGDLEPLGELQGRIDQEVSLAGGFLRESRHFSPHLTLGRLHDNVRAEERRWAGKAATLVTLETEVWWEVGEVKLMRSTLTSAGAVYDALGTTQL